MTRLPLHYEWSWTSRASPEAIWPLVSDTARVNRAVRLPPWHFDVEPDPEGGTRRLGGASYFGVDVRWEELPFEWRLNEQFSIERRYRNGPFARIVSRVSLVPEPGGTRLVHALDVEPRGPLGALACAWQFGLQSRRAFDRVYRRLLAFAENPRGPAFVEPAPQLRPGAEDRLARLTRELAATQPEALVERLATVVRTAPDREARRLRPFALAKAWDVPRHDVLRACLHAARAGLLQLSWDMLCPHCRGVRTAGSLAALASAAHCDSCNVTFELDFSRSVELSFAPAPALRALDDAEYCVGGPGNTPHVVAQRRLAPGTSETVTLALPPGTYRLRGPKFQGALLFDVAPGGAPSTTFDTADPAPRDARVAPSFTLAISNARAPRENLVVVERTAWLDDAATGDVVTSLQEFRDLFPDDALAPGERLRVARLAFLFTDLKNSTALYERIGDAPAYALVRAHFDVLQQAVVACEGTVVKTIGDAVMAVFADPAQAVRAADRMFAGIDRLGERAGRHDERLTIKVGLHAGPCLAVTLNERLDYFGTTVNLSARVQGESVGGDLVVTRELAEDPSVAAYLARRALEREPFTTRVKGIRSDVDLERVRFQPGDPPA